MMLSVFASFVANFVVILVHLFTAVQGRWLVAEPAVAVQRIYFANHASHGDFALIWTVLPAALRRTVRPVAGADYWLATGLRQFMALHVFRSVLIDRNRMNNSGDPFGTLAEALADGSSLILFPEGTRNTTASQLLPFKSGLFRLGRSHPRVELVPVWITNLNRVLPMGELLPVPMLCTVTFGHPLQVADGEDKDSFLNRAQQALAELAPRPEDER